MSKQTRLTISLVVLALAALPAAAQPVDLFAGFTMAKMTPANESLRTTLNGWNSSVTVYKFNRLGFTADVAGQYGSTNSATYGTINVHQHSLMAGPQIRLLSRQRFETSFKALFGAAHGHVPLATGYPAGDTAFAALLGSNFDVNLSRRVAFRISPGLFVTRYGDEFASGTQKNLRFTAGLVFRLGGE